MSFSARAAEVAVCAAALQRNEWADAAFDRLAPTYFEDRQLGALWGAIGDCRRKGRAAKPDTLEPWCAGREDWSLAALLALMSQGQALTAHQFQSSVDTVLEAYEGRELALAASDISALVAEAGEMSRVDLLAMMEQRLRAVPLTSTATTMTAGEVAMARAQNFNSQEARGLPTGIEALDRRIGGFAKTDLILMAGRPSMGKSALLSNAVLAMGKAGAVGHFASAEMSQDQVGDRMLSAASFADEGHRFQYRDVRALNPERRPKADVMQALAKLYADYPITYDFSPVQSVAHIRREARRTKQKYGRLDFIAVDHTHRLKADGKVNGNVERFDQIAEGLKSMAREFGVPVIAAAQLNRVNEHEEDKRPQLSNLRNSGAFEMEADVVILVHRESYYLSRKEPQNSSFTCDADYHAAWVEWDILMKRAHGKLELNTAKQRQGENGIDTVVFHAGYDVIHDEVQQ